MHKAPLTAPVVRVIPAQATHVLRQRVLRPHQRVDEMVYAGDTDAETVHFGGFAGEELVAIASLYRAPLPPAVAEAGIGTLPHEQWQFRGMASDESVRGRGFAAAVLDAVFAHARAQGGTLIWCNAREAAVWFYERANMRRVGAWFEIPQIGAHIVMAAPLR